MNYSSVREVTEALAAGTLRPGDTFSLPENLWDGQTMCALLPLPLEVVTRGGKPIPRRGRPAETDYPVKIRVRLWPQMLLDFCQKSTQYDFQGTAMDPEAEDIWNYTRAYVPALQDPNTDTEEYLEALVEATKIMVEWANAQVEGQDEKEAP